MVFHLSLPLTVLRLMIAEKAEILNNYFQSVYTREDVVNVPVSGTPYPEMPQITVTPEGVKKLLMDLQPNKASGPDQLPARILKECAEELAPILSAIFNQLEPQLAIFHLTGLCPISPLFLKRVTKICPVITDPLLWHQFAAKYWSTSLQATSWIIWTASLQMPNMVLGKGGVATLSLPLQLAIIYRQIFWPKQASGHCFIRFFESFPRSAYSSAQEDRPLWDQRQSTWLD